MDGPTQSQNSQLSRLQKQAIQNAQSAYSSLPHGDAIFQQCVTGKDTLTEVLKSVEETCKSFKKRESTRLLEKLENYTTWLQNFSGVVDVAVQTQAGIACPLWAPIKFVLKVSNDLSNSTKQITDLLQVLKECLPRLEIYEQLRAHDALQVALLAVFTDVVDFAARAFHFFRQKTIVRLSKIIVRTFDQEIGAVIAQLERHAREADQTAVATQLLEAARFRKETERRHYDLIKAQCESWLKPCDMESVHQHQLGCILPGTCDWIATNEEYTRWVGPGTSSLHDRLLVVSGKHGCGKSVLTSWIIVKLKSDRQRVLFFSFSALDRGRQTSTSLIKTLLWQLLLQVNSKDSLDTVQRLKLDGQPSIVDFWETFASIASSLVEPIYCVIDAVDECVDFDSRICMQITQMIGRCSNLHMLLLGRPHVVQAQSDKLNFTAIEMNNAQVRQDIQIFMEDEVSKSQILSLPEFRNTVLKTLQDKSDGMFLWVRLMVDELKRSTSKSELRERLRRLPPGLEEAYNTVFLRLAHQLDSFELRLVQNVLAFMMVCCRPLHFDEINYLYALRCKSLEEDTKPLEEYLLLLSPQKTIDLLGGMVIVNGGFLHFVHSSIQEFLIRPTNRWDPNLCNATLDLRVIVTETHQSFACLCLDFLEVEQAKNGNGRPDAPRHVAAFQKGHSMLHYAISYTFFHLNRSDHLSPVTVSKISQVFETTTSIFWVEHFAHFLFEDIALDTQVREFETFVERLENEGQTAGYLTLLQSQSKKMLDCTDRNGMERNSRAEQWDMVLDLVEDHQFGPFRNPSIESVEVKPELGPTLVSHTSSSKNPELRSRDPSSALFGMINVLKTHDNLPVSRQIDIFLKLQTSLKRTRVLVDPLKALFRLILKKASTLPVYVLMEIAFFYKKLGKYSEELEVWIVASKKMEGLEVPPKYDIQAWMGVCYRKLGMLDDALKCHIEAFDGRKVLCGVNHKLTYKSFCDVLHDYNELHRWEDVIQACNTLRLGQSVIKDLDIQTELKIESNRCHAYLHMNNLDQADYAQSRIQILLETQKKSIKQEKIETAFALVVVGLVHDSLCQDDTALRFFELSLDEYTKKHNNLMMLRVRTWMALSYAGLGQKRKAWSLMTKAYAEQKELLAPNHPDIAKTKGLMIDLALDDEDSNEYSYEGELRDQDSETCSFDCGYSREYSYEQEPRRRNSADF